ncbi:SAC domain-containing protein [Artemisia annua]|uniref:SAC domain-containing protein n=1 Tax=Artemisia annua TaxID=35608 RepID=A0A2U1MZJ8_ARTAN|nr:SAC domain-containing protein [Artemisia annua]
MTAAEAAIYVSDNDPYKGSAQYFQRLVNRYDTRNLDVLGANQNKNCLVPIVCVSLLRSGEGKSEAILVRHFEESLNYIRNRLKGEQQTIEGLWYHLKAPTITIGISEGDYLLSRQDMENCEGDKIYNDDVSGFFCLRVHQNGVTRYNCADSLDRTNAASFFWCPSSFNRAM